MVIKKKNPNLVLKRITDKNGVARKVWVKPYKGEIKKPKEKSFEDSIKEFSDNEIDLLKVETLDDSDKKNLEESFKRFDVNEFFEKYIDAFPFRQEDFDEVSIDFRKNMYGIVILNLNKDNEVQIVRNINYQWGTVTHDSFFIESEEEQGKGIGREVMKRSIEMYKDAGMKKIRSLCNADVGGYSWARMGYKAESFAEVLDVLKYSFKRNKTSKGDKDLIDKVLRKWAEKNDVNKDEFPMDLIAGIHDKDGRKIGKDVLLGTSWNGIFNLNDDETLDVFNKYVKSKKDEKR